MPNYVPESVHAARRFVAGAVCPRCGEMDKTVLIREAETERRECIACGFSEGGEERDIAEPATRVNQAAPDRDTLPHEEPVQAIKFIDAGAGGDE